MNERLHDILEKEVTPGEEKELQELLKPYKDGSVGVAQINLIAGDIEYNAEKIVKYIKIAQNIGLDIVVFPELTMIGFPLEDAIGKFPVIAEENVKWLNEIAKITLKTTCLVGFLEPCEDENMYYSSVAVLRNGKITEIIRKSALSQNCEFNDYNYIELSESEHKVIDINNIKYGIIIGEDYNAEIWNDKPDVLINICAIPERYSDAHLKYVTSQYSAPFICVNAVGTTDNVSYDGASCAYSKEGKLIARAKSFEEQFIVINPLKNFGKINSKIEMCVADDFTLDYDKSDLERTYKILFQGIKDYFCKTGFKRAVLGLSGGLDSTVCAVLLTDVLGAENVFGISMPSEITSKESKNDAQILAENLGINFTIAPIKQMFNTTNNCLQELFKDVEKKWDGRYKKSFTPDNIQARSRAMFLWGVSNEFGSCLPIATSDKSEAYMGYATINGDMSGGFAPIADITKTKLFALAKWLNENRTHKNAIPQSVIEKRPGAELAIDPNTGKPLCAEDALMPYEFLDEVIWRIEHKKESYNDMISSEFVYEKTHSVQTEQKTEWLNKFFRRMSTALYKKSIMPPCVIVDSPLYNYKQPITSGRINYKGLSGEDIAEKIRNFGK